MKKATTEMIAKNNVIGATLIVLALLFGCDEVDKLLTFYISHDAAIRIESASPLNLPFEVITPAITTNSSQEFENNNTRANLVKDVKLEFLRLSVTSPEGKTFSFLKAIHIYISTTDDNEIELAYLDDISSSATTLTLICSDEKLDEYIKSTTYNIRTEAVTRETLTEDVDTKVDFRFKVTANPL